MLIQAFLERDFISSNGRPPVSVFGSFVEDYKDFRVPEEILKGRKVKGPFTNRGFMWHGIVFFIIKD